MLPIWEFGGGDGSPSRDDAWEEGEVGKGEEEVM